MPDQSGSNDRRRTGKPGRSGGPRRTTGQNQSSGGTSKRRQPGGDNRRASGKTGDGSGNAAHKRNEPGSERRRSEPRGSATGRRTGGTEGKAGGKSDGGWKSADSRRQDGGARRQSADGDNRGGRGTGSRANQYGSDRGRSRETPDRGVLRTGSALPKWIREEITRSTPKERREPALQLLTEGSELFAAERFGPALRTLRQAKAVAPRSATIRELLGLAAYNSEVWEEALRELRTFRRLAGETTHMPEEIDCLRALGRHADIEKVWIAFGELGGSRLTEDEVRVVYSSHLLDQGRLREAWDVAKPGRLVAQANPSTLRRWFVAARIALAGGDVKTAETLHKAISSQDSEIPGLTELGTDIAARKR